MFWCVYCSVSFQSFPLRHLVIAPVNNTKKQHCFTGSKFVPQNNLISQRGQAVKYLNKRVCSHKYPASTILGHRAREPSVNSAYYCSLEHSNCSTPCLLAFNLSLQTIPRSFVVAYEHGEVKLHYIKLLSLKGIRLQRANVYLRKVVKIYSHLHGGGAASLYPPTKQTSVKFRELRSYVLVSFQQITFKLGNFTNFKALFPVDFP